MPCIRKKVLTEISTSDFDVDQIGMTVKMAGVSKICGKSVSGHDATPTLKNPPRGNRIEQMLKNPPRGHLF